MKKQYIFLIFIWIILYLLFLIVSYKYKEYNTNYYIELLKQENEQIKREIEIKQKLNEYYNTNAYKNKILKEQHWYQNKNEVVINITTESNYNKFTKEPQELVINEIKPKEVKIYENMSIQEKWFYFIFNKDIR